jgi:iron uptake system component EfeO
VTNRLLPLCFAALVGGLAMAACSDSGDGPSIVVKAGDSSCVPEKTEIAAGKITFTAKNEGNDVTELYVLGEGDQIRGEVENVAPGTSRDLHVDLTAGDYTLNCKPGQTGDGIRTAIKVTGSGGTATKAASRQVEIVGKEYSFEGADKVHPAKGETITLELKNEGTIEHEMEVFGPDGDALGEVGPTKAGAEGKVTITFDEAGAYVLKCGIEDHESRGMTASFTVS